jgi:hypothetical protein
MTHQEIDQRTRAIHLLIAEKIRQNPLLLEKAKDTIARWQKIVCNRSLPDLHEWDQLIDQGVDVCLAVITSESEHATALRQSSPFVGILTNRERFEFLKAWSLGSKLKERKSHAPQ